MPTMTGVAVVGVTPEGKKFELNYESLSGPGGPLTTDEALQSLTRLVRLYQEYPEYDQFEIYNLNFGRENMLVLTIRRDAIA